MSTQAAFTKRYAEVFESELIQEIMACGQFNLIAEGTQLMEVGQAITHMPLVISGSLKVLTEDEKGDELLLYYLEFGDTCAMTLNCCSRMAKSSVSAIAEKESEVLFVPVEKMDEWLVNFKSWRTFVLESYNSRLNEMIEAIDNLAFHNMEERLKRYLRDRSMVMQNGDLTITHLQISTDLNSSRVVISRLMKKLEQSGFLAQYRNRVQVLEFES